MFSCIYICIYVCIFVIDNLPANLFKMVLVRIENFFSSSSHAFLFELNKRRGLVTRSRNPWCVGGGRAISMSKIYAAATTKNKKELIRGFKARRRTFPFPRLFDRPRPRHANSHLSEISRELSEG